MDEVYSLHLCPLLQGRILLDGVPLVDIDTRWYRRLIGYVAQVSISKIPSPQDFVSFGCFLGV